MRLIRIDHVALDVTDRARSLAWYADVLGVRADGRPGPAGEPVFLGPAGARLALFEHPTPRVRHVALATDARGQRRVIERLEQLTIPYNSERHRASDSIYFRDPDGATLEVMVPTG
jgi:catechol 2,3-dioxygenase-like lactoylglutathione lyase family enzyme